MSDPSDGTVSPLTTPVSLDLKRDERLLIRWQDGTTCVYPVSLLRARCPCAQCKTIRQDNEAPKPKRPKLTILPGNHSEPLSALSAELVGNYALKIEWSDRHGSGIYSFRYLREICPPTP
jgi:DUF971 family protein